MDPSCSLVKRYYSGNALAIYYSILAMEYACKGGAVYDEYIESGQPLPLCFDVEIKKKQGWTHERFKSTFGCAVQDVILDEAKSIWSELEMGEFDIDEHREKVDVLAKLYLDMLERDWNEWVCKASCEVITSHISQMLVSAVGNKARNDQGIATGLYTTMACRDDKFSIHIVSNKVWCDSFDLSMKLLVFEIARF